VRLSPVVLLCAGALSAAPDRISTALDVAVPMRDGVRLSANVFRPEAPGRYPTILVRTPYGKGSAISPNYAPFVERGYAVVVQDVRGRYASEGVFRPLEQEPADGGDTLDWIARQPWSDGKIGMLGGSYLGIVQWKVAALNNPHLKAIFPSVSGCDDYLDRFYSPGGAMKLGQRLLWMSENLRAPHFHPDFAKFVLHLPLRTADVAATGQTSSMFQEAVAHPAYDSFWKSISVREQLDKIRVPVFSVGGWFDNFVESDLLALRAPAREFRRPPHPDRAVAPQHGGETGWRGLRTGFRCAHARDSTAVVRPVPERQGHAAAFAASCAHLRDGCEPLARGTGVAAARASATLLSGKPRPRQHAGGRWPASPSHAGRSGQPADRFVFDPQDPVPTAGGAVCCNPKVFPWGPRDQRAVEQRRDVLVYTTAPLPGDVEVVGPVRVVLYAATSARDTDFTAKLVDVLPDGRAQNLTDGILRLRYRNRWKSRSWRGRAKSTN
jgi:uncharacterized protein